MVNRDMRDGGPRTGGEMVEQAIKVGDAVRLRSGGPAMTVEALEGGIARVVWIDNEQQKHRESPKGRSRRGTAVAQ
jgi:uncharacterized protein YodC (DUF2158 family)